MIRGLGLLAVAASIAAGQRTIYPAAKEGVNYMHNYYLPPAPSSYARRS